MTTEEKAALLSDFEEVRQAKRAAYNAVGYNSGGTSVQRQSLHMLIKEESRLVELLKQNGISAYSGEAIATTPKIRRVYPV